MDFSSFVFLAVLFAALGVRIWAARSYAQWMDELPAAERKRILSHRLQAWH